jgi:hypothetical protein
MAMLATMGEARMRLHSSGEKFALAFMSIPDRYGVRSHYAGEHSSFINHDAATLFALIHWLRRPRVNGRPPRCCGYTSPRLQSFNAEPGHPAALQKATRRNARVAFFALSGRAR